MNIEVIRSRRKTLALQVREDGSVTVRAPFFIREREIKSFVQQHADWILRQQERMRSTAAARRDVPPLTAQEMNALTHQARRDLTMRAASFASQIGVSYGRIAIRRQKTKWGSCSAKGNLNFNCLLMLAPEAVRDYVVVHELCHRKHMNHSQAFWAEVGRILPDYREARKWLKTHGNELMLRRPEAGE